MLELISGDLTPDKVTTAVRRPGAGGIVTFVGCVRDTSEGKQVEYLEYEAYERMALEKMRQICDEVRAQWPVMAMGIQHRLGRLEIGDDAVVIAVSCPHRAEAFEACHYAIDRLKEIVPIWKKEHGEDGAIWVGGPTESASSPAPD